MGNRGETVTVFSQRLLADHGGLRGLLRLEVAELVRVKGLGDAKAVHLAVDAHPLEGGETFRRRNPV
jgi:DNA repair protein RadC